MQTKFITAVFSVTLLLPATSSPFKQVSNFPVKFVQASKDNSQFEEQKEVPLFGRQTKVINAQKLFGEWTNRDFALSPTSDHIKLEYGETYEDDGAAAGHTYTPNKEELSDLVWARKELIVANPQARTAILLLEHTGMPAITINQQQIELKPVKGGSKAWKAYSFDPALLRKGSNMITISGKATIPVALQQHFETNALTNHPDRSFRSADGGKTWNKTHRGPKGDLDGEYYVRLYLEHYRPRGRMFSHVIDAGNLKDQTIAPALTGLKPVQVRVNGKNGKDGKIILRARTGSTLVPSANSWSEWKELNPFNSIIHKPKGRYIQLSLEVSTSNPLQSPELYSVSIEANHLIANNWAKNLKMTHHQNKKITRSVIDFEYEKFDHPKLQQLRKEYHLDSIVNGAATEFEIITRLAAWSAKQWKKMHLSESYPPWDALEILKPHKDGTPVGGFCQQYNVVFLQACGSFGLAGRAVSIGPGETTDHAIKGGHEVVEIWSNEYDKWIYVDGNMAWYATDENNVPLSLYELRLRQLALLKGKDSLEIKFVEIAPSTRKWQSLSDWPPFMELRLIPGSNFLEKAAPLPLNQGMHDWPWTGHEVWVDDQTSPTLIYPKRIRRTGNWQWTLNQANINLEATGTPGVVLVHLDTNTPGSQSFVANIDNAGSKEVSETFKWVLHNGVNKLQVNSKNIAGRSGPKSSIVLEWNTTN